MLLVRARAALWVNWVFFLKKNKVMAPIRGSKKKRKLEKKNEGSGSGSSEKEGSVDWWHEFYQRINGKIYL